MTTNNAVNTNLSGQTGTGNFVGATTPTLITPVLGVATATSIVFSPATSGIIGVSNASNASSGIAGEFISSVIAFASAISITNATATNLTSISLTAGDWDVYGNIYFNASGVVTAAIGWISTTSATVPDASLTNRISGSAISATGIDAPYTRINISSTTTVYISGFTNFSTGSSTISGGIYARRAR